MKNAKDYYHRGLIIKYIMLPLGNIVE